MKDKIKNLYSKDNISAYKSLLELELICTESNVVYVYFDEFLNMLNHPISYIRVRGFRLICSLAKWDNENKINNNISLILRELEDDKATAVRQCLNSIKLILLYKCELTHIIEEKIRNMDTSKFNDSMKPLIEKDIKTILERL